MFGLIVLCISLLYPLTRVAPARGGRGGRYDQRVNVFSPEGDLLQVQYAERAAARGAPLACLVCGSRIVLCAPARPLDDLLDRRLTHKVDRVDEGMWLGFAGLASDGRALLQVARRFALAYRSQFGVVPSAAAVANHLGELQHATTLKGSERPYGVHVLILGFDVVQNQATPCVYMVHASGHASKWKGAAIGAGAKSICSALAKADINALQSTEDAVAVLTRVMRRQALLEVEESAESLVFDVTVLEWDGRLGEAATSSQHLMSRASPSSSQPSEE